jgi:hypothetical protein
LFDEEGKRGGDVRADALDEAQVARPQVLKDARQRASRKQAEPVRAAVIAQSLRPELKSHFFAAFVKQNLMICVGCGLSSLSRSHLGLLVFPMIEQSHLFC